MRIGVALLLFFVANLASARDPKEVGAFVEKQNECDVATYEAFKSKADWKYNPTAVYCIGDLKTNAGTINEKEGCAAYVFNFANGTRGPISPEIGIHIVQGKSCADGGVQAVLELQELPPYKRKIKDVMGPKTTSGKVDRIVVFAKKDSYKKLLGY